MRGDSPIYGEFGERYYPAAVPSDLVGISRLSGERSTVELLCSLSKERLDWFGWPAALFGDTDDEEAVRDAFKVVDSVRAGRKAIILDTSRDSLSRIGTQCLNRGGVPSLKLTAICDLTSGEAGMRKALRQSAKPQINWGKKNLAIKSATTRAEFDTYRDFHAHVAGRVTRPVKSWDIMWEALEARKGSLLLGSLGLKLVAGVLAFDGETTTTYWSAAYDRDLFDKPIAHWPLWVSMLHAAERGMQTYELGDLPLPGACTPKEANIGFFKRGFATHIRQEIVWTIPA